jgi:hypothetical protein
MGVSRTSIGVIARQTAWWSGDSGKYYCKRLSNIAAYNACPLLDIGVATMNNDSSIVFCPDAFWDANLTWYTDTPDFTACFHQTVLVYLPCLVAILVWPVELFSIRKRTKRQVV